MESAKRRRLSGKSANPEVQALWRSQLGPGWTDALRHELQSPEFAETLRLVAEERCAHPGSVFPPAEQVFRAFAAVPLEDVRVVIVGQDPYHGAGQAHGLSFSVPRGIRKPPSLQNMLKELNVDVPNARGDLSAWAAQGVLLLNSVLTVREAQPGSHAKFGWQRFTDAALQAVSRSSRFAVFMLWGKTAAEKAELVDARHEVLVGGHPSPLSYHKHFKGCDHFNRANRALLAHGRGPQIDWWAAPAPEEATTCSNTPCDTPSCDTEGEQAQEGGGVPGGPTAAQEGSPPVGVAAGRSSSKKSLEQQSPEGTPPACGAQKVSRESARKASKHFRRGSTLELGQSRFLK